MAIHLGRPLPDASRDRPGQRFGNPLASMFSKVTPASIPTCRPYLVLLLVGFAVPLTLPSARCALTAPFHPYQFLPRKEGTGGLLSVALSLGLPPPGVTRHRVSMEPGLSSPRRVSPLPKGGHPAIWCAAYMRFPALTIQSMTKKNRRVVSGLSHDLKQGH